MPALVYSYQTAPRGPPENSSLSINLTLQKTCIFEYKEGIFVDFKLSKHKTLSCITKKFNYS